MNLFDVLGIYCERSGGALWAEPLNTLSSVAFFVVAWRLWLRQLPSEARREARRMAVMLVVVGVGSLLFHLTGQLWAHWLNMGCIVLFIGVFLQRYLSQVVRTHSGTLILSVAGMLLLGETIRRIGGLGLNDSEFYLGPAICLIFLARWAMRKSTASAPWMLAAAALFPVALAVLSIDRGLCAAWPAGTHFGWHLLVAVVLYLSVRGLAAGCHERSGRYHGLLTSDTVMEQNRRR